MEGHPNIWIQIIVPIIAAVISGIIGPLIVYFVTRRDPRKYFDLDNRARKTARAMTEELRRILEGEPVRDVILSKLEKEKAEEAEKPVSKFYGEEMELSFAAPLLEGPTYLSLTRQILMYVGILIGVLFSTAVSQFERGGDFSIIINGGTVLISAIIALILTPIVYEKLSLVPASPFIVRFGLFVQNGVFWHVIINSIGKVVQ